MLIRGDVFHVHTMSQFLEDDLFRGCDREEEVAEVFEPDVLKPRRRKKMKEWFAIIMGASLLVLMVPILYRIVMGPTGFDRILGVNVISTKTAVILVIIGTLFDRVEMFVDFAIAYALLNFVGAIVVSRYFNRTVPLKDMEKPRQRRRAKA